MIRILGDTKFTIENKLFNAFCLIAIVSCLIGFYFNNSIGLTPLFNIVFAILSIVFGILYYFGRFKQKINTHVFVAVSLPSLSVIYFLSAGSNGIVLLLYVVAIIAFVSFSNNRFHIYYLIATILNIMILLVLENLFYDTIIIPYPNELVKQIDFIFTFSACFIICYIIIRYFKKLHKNENETIQNQSIKLRELNATKDKFFSIIAHDLRSPLGAVIGLGELMANEKRDYSLKEIKEMNRLMNASLKNTYNLLENLLNWAKIQQGTINTQPEHIPLFKLIDSELNLLHTAIKNKNLDIKINVPEELVLQTDRNIIQIVIRNLISNAIKFTPTEGSIVISAMDKNNLVDISISDSGIGMPPEMINNLYKIDIITNRPGTDGEPSAGIGLILCKEFIEKLGGNIEIESEVNIGSKIKITIPQCQQ